MTCTCSSTPSFCRYSLVSIDRGRKASREVLWSTKGSGSSMGTRGVPQGAELNQTLQNHPGVLTVCKISQISLKHFNFLNKFPPTLKRNIYFNAGSLQRCADCIPSLRCHSNSGIYFFLLTLTSSSIFTINPKKKENHLDQLASFLCSGKIKSFISAQLQG